MTTGSAVLGHALAPLTNRGGALSQPLTYQALADDTVGLGVGYRSASSAGLVLHANLCRAAPAVPSRLLSLLRKGHRPCKVIPMRR